MFSDKGHMFTYPLEKLSHDCLKKKKKIISKNKFLYVLEKIQIIILT